MVHCILRGTEQVLRGERSMGVLKAKEFKQFRIVPRTPTIGGMIEGCHLSELDEEGVRDLRTALWEYGVLFAKKQSLTFDQMKDIAYIFGDKLEHHSFAPTLAEQGHPEVLLIERLKSDKTQTTTDIWHHDVSARKHPNIMSILQADTVPFGADTMWASMTAAYERLPYALKLLFLNIGIDHDSLYLLLRHDFGSDKINVEQVAKLQEASTHPAVVSHHATGKPCLFVGNAYVKRVNGYSTDLSEMIIKIANEIPKVPEIQVRHQWESGDVAIWDNFGTAHYGVTADLGSEIRRLHRVASWSENVSPKLNLDAALAELKTSQSSSLKGVA